MTLPLNINKLKEIYQSHINWLIDNAGKPVILYFQETVTNVDETFDDFMRDGNIRKPLYKGDNTIPAPTIVENTKTITALIEYNPKDFQDYGPKVNDPKSIVRLKTYLKDVPDILRCEYMTPSAETIDILHKHYRLLREPIPFGLREEKYAISYWNRI